MKVYKCDACERVIEDPHTVKMKEFYTVTTFDDGTYFPLDVSRKIKVHLCNACYKGLSLIANKVYESKKIDIKEN